MDQAAEGIDDPWARIEARGRAYIDFALNEPEHYRVIMMSRREEIPNANANDLPPGYEHLVADVRDAIEIGEIPGEHDALIVATGLWMTVHGVVSLMITKPDFPWPPRDQLVDHVLGVCAAGLSGRPDGPVRS